MGYNENAAWFKSMYGQAQRASNGTGVPASVILAHWALETGYGTSASYTEGNNLGGIKYVGQALASGALYGHSKYDSVDKAVDDYIRVMNFSYYDKVRSAGNPESAIERLHESPWAEDPSQNSKLKSIFNAYGLRGYDTYKGGSAPAPSAGLPADMSAEDMKKYAAIGVAFVALMALTR